MIDAPAWQCERSVDADVSLSFAWRYMTDVSNWSDPPAEFSLDGPFAAGSHGTTRTPGQADTSWVIREVMPGEAYTLEAGSLPDGVQLLFHWRFDALSDRRTKMTQRIELRGENAAAHVDGMRAAFEPNLEPGMRRIAEIMTRVASDPGLS